MPSLRTLRARRSGGNLLALSLATLGALAGTARTAHAMSQAPACTPPTLQQCDDPAYTSSACGQQETATCNAIIVNAYTAQYPTAGESKLEFAPNQPPIASNLRAGRWSPYDPSHLAVIASADPSYAGDQVPSLVAGPSVASGASRLGSLVGPIAGPYEGDGTAVTSCREYVFKRYWDYTEFQRAAASCGRDSRCVYDAAMTGAHAITKPVLYEANGKNALDQQIPIFVGHKSKNLFFDTPVTTWSTDPVRRARLAAITARQAASASYYRIGTGEKWIPVGLSGEIFADEWAFHRSLHDRNVSVSDAQLQEYAERRRKLRDLIATRDALMACYEGGICSEANPYYMQSVKDNDEAMFQLVSDEWDLGNDGCMSTSNFACDWSPDDFRTQFAYLFGKEMQAAYTDCTSLGGSAAFSAANVPTGPVTLYGVTVSPRSDVPAYSTWSALRKQQLLAEFAALPKYPEADGSQLPGHVGSKMSGSNTLGDKSLFLAGYDYSLDWDIRKVVQKSATDTQACAYAGSFNAKFHADATLLGTSVATAIGLTHIASSETSIADDARVDAGVPLVSTRTTILGNDVYSALTNAYVSTWTAPLSEESVQTNHFSQTFVIVVVPVTFDVYGQLSYGATANLSTQATIDCVNAPQFGLNLSLTPYVHADAVATIAVGVPGFEVGVKGELALVHIDMPISGGVNVAQSAAQTPVLRFTTRGDIELGELSGQLSLFADALWLTYEHELFQWNGLHQSLNLWKTQSDVELAAYRLVNACPITNVNCGL